MRTWMSLWSLLAACSIPDTQFTPSGDGSTTFDVDPSMLALTAVEPAMIYEGQGDGGGRPVVLVIEGSNISATDISVSIVMPLISEDQAEVTVDNANLRVSRDGTRLAVPLVAHVDPLIGAGTTLALSVMVTQHGTTQMLADALLLVGLDELTAMPVTLPSFSRYSRVELSSGVIPDPQAGPLIIESTSSFELASGVTATFDGGVLTAGPNGGTGGVGGSAGISADPGRPGNGPAAGTAGQSAGAFTGDSQLTTLDREENRGSGGGGGNSGPLLGQRGGGGGGGGGTVAFTAAGDVTIATSLSARGGQGETQNVANPGGNGSGGVILVRGGGNVAVPMLDVSGGQAGRARVDAGGTRATVGTAYRGAMFANVPLVVTEATPTLELVGQPNATAAYTVTRGNVVSAIVPKLVGADGTSMITIDEPLRAGLNELCALVDGAPATSDTRNCVTVAYVATAP